MNEQEIPAYDEDQAIAFIRQAVTPEVSARYTDDDLLFVIDSIWDHYEAAGLTSLDPDATDADEADLAATTAYVKKAVRADGHILMTDADLDHIVKAEFEYEKTLEDFID